MFRSNACANSQKFHHNSSVRLPDLSQVESNQVFQLELLLATHYKEKFDSPKRTLQNSYCNESMSTQQWYQPFGDVLYANFIEAHSTRR